ncbi:MAG: hypothetical protein ACI4F5_06320 [Acutalibacteraceae bacterium]
MIGRLKDLTFERNGDSVITVTVQTDFGEEFDRLKDFDIDVEIKRHREKRSRNANAYFHVLVNKIARSQGISDTEVKKQLVLDYGAVAVNSDGSRIGFMLPEGVNVDGIYPYTKWFDCRVVNGKRFDCYLAYKHTHELDTAEMSKLIDGTVYVAKELGIETATPDEIERMKALWAEKENDNDK